MVFQGIHYIKLAIYTRPDHLTLSLGDSIIRRYLINNFYTYPRKYQQDISETSWHFLSERKILYSFQAFKCSQAIVSDLSMRMNNSMKSLRGILTKGSSFGYILSRNRYRWYIRFSKSIYQSIQQQDIPRL